MFGVDDFKVDWLFLFLICGLDPGFKSSPSWFSFVFQFLIGSLEAVPIECGSGALTFQFLIGSLEAQIHDSLMR